MMSAWASCLLEAIETAESIGMTDESPEAALVLVRGDDNARMRYTLSECKEELSKLLASEKMS